MLSRIVTSLMEAKCHARHWGRVGIIRTTLFTQELVPGGGQHYTRHPMALWRVNTTAESDEVGDQEGL